MPCCPGLRTFLNLPPTKIVVHCSASARSAAARASAFSFAAAFFFDDPSSMAFRSAISNSAGLRQCSGSTTGLAASHRSPGVSGNTRRSSRIAPPRVWYGY